MADPGPGEWQETRNPCACVCPPPDVEVQFTYRPDDEESWAVWESFFNDSYTPASTLPETEDAHTVASVRFRYTPNGLPWQMRYRLVTSTQVLGVYFYTVGSEQLLIDPAGTGVLKTLGGDDTLVIEAPADDLSYNYFTGPAGKPAISIDRLTRVAALSKKGWAPYRGQTGDESKFYRQEAVVSGGFPGATDLPAETYSGLQHYLTDGVDPGATFESTLSRDLRSRGYASAPLGSRRISNRFGEIAETETTRLMTETMVIAGATVTKSLSLELSDEYTTDDLQSAVNAVLGTLSDTVEPGPGPVALDRLTPGESYLERRRSTVRVNSTTPLLYMNEGDVLGVTVRWTKRVIDLATRAVTDTTETGTFTLVVLTPQPVGTGKGRETSAGAGPEIPVTAAPGTQVEILNFDADAQAEISSPFFLEPYVP